MKYNSKQIALAALLLISCICATTANAISYEIVHDKQKEKQWRSMELGPWDFAPDWYYLWFHKNYSGATSRWQWAGFHSGYVVEFKEEKSNVKRINPVRVMSEETQRLKSGKVRDEYYMVKQVLQEDELNFTDRNVDVVYSLYKDDFNSMQTSISDGLSFCMSKSNGAVAPIADEILRENEILCENIKYVNKKGLGYEMENAKRQECYDDIKKDMQSLVKRTYRLALITNSLY